jgi:lipoic acid synthetase
LNDRLPVVDSPPRRRHERPAWLRVRYREDPELTALQDLVRELDLHTVCESAACPNLPECWARGTATFMIGGNLCTRRCGFCDVQTGRPAALDAGEPARVAEAIARLRLRFAVVTAVARARQADGGAAHIAPPLAAIHARAPGCRVEVLIPDFKGSEAALRTVLDAGPDVLNHNVETVERLQRRVRPAARYRRSLELLSASRRLRPDVPTKTGIMLGLGDARRRARARLCPDHDRPVPLARARSPARRALGAPRGLRALGARRARARLRRSGLGPAREELLPRRAARRPMTPLACGSLRGGRLSSRPPCRAR